MKNSKLLAVIRRLIKPFVMPRFFKSEVNYLITYVGGFSESNHPIHRWNGSKVVKAPKSKDINEIISEVRKETTSGAYGYFELKNVSIIK